MRCSLRYTNRIAALVITCLALMLAMPAAMAEEEAVEIEWLDLMPEGWIPAPSVFNPSLNHESQQSGFETPPPAPVVEEMDGKLVRLPGYIVPLDFNSTEVSEFLLVPYVGACIHVPPPPSNQVIYSESDKAIKIGGLWDAVWITGRMTTTHFSHDLAEAGYSIKVENVEPYR